MNRTVAYWLLSALLTVSAAARAAPGDTIYAHPGRLVSVGDGARLNFICKGAGSPAVVFESTFGDWAPAWAIVLPRIAAWTQACVYEHAGAGFSEPGPMPRTNIRLANELDEALHNAGIAGPYILVGNASGGQPARTFAQVYMAETAGLVLVEPDVTDLEPKSMQDKDHASNAGGIAELRKCRDAVAARTSHPDPTCAKFFFRGLPEPKFSPELNAALLNLLQSKVAVYDAALAEWEQMPQTEGWLQQHSQSLGRRPVRVLTTGNHAVHFLPAPNAHDPKHLEYEHQIELAQARLIALSSNARQIFVPNSSEYVQFDDPDAVVEAIREVYDQSRDVKHPFAGASASEPQPSLTTATRSEHAPGSVFRDCPDCPEMVVIPAGSFTMGSSAAEKSWAAGQVGSADGVADESPQHHVSLPSFAMGKYDVTRSEYAAFVRETGHSVSDGCGRDSFKWVKRPELTWQHPGFKQTDRDPVVCVSWQDANAYVAWLNGKVRQEFSASGAGPYRLPSESQWEYAARAGSSTRFWWGDDDAAMSDDAWYKYNSGARTHPVGLKLANAFGLYDVVGNVWQWTEDCYDNSYAGAPTDGRANEIPSSDVKANDSEGKCLRVDRGASFSFRSWALRSATRERNPADYRDAYMGFRVARSLP